LTQIDLAVEDIKSDDRRVERFMTLATKLEDVRYIARKEALEEGRAEGRAEGEREAKVGLVKRLLARAMSLEDIADACALDLDAVKKIAEEA
jgi:predicted transposase/invertase (TIGR01784 family)